MNCKLCLSVVGLILSLSSSLSAQEKNETAVLAGGCFWCLEASLEGKPGILSVVSGFAGGVKPSPTYDEVSQGGTGYTESVEVRFDPTIISYPQLLDLFWRNIDPVDGGGQFCDRGDQYTAKIFPRTDVQMKEAQGSKAQIEKRIGQPVQVEIKGGATFYPAEEYHQDYYRKNPESYKKYRLGCGRDRRLEEVWGASSPSMGSLLH